MTNLDIETFWAVVQHGTICLLYTSDAADE